MFTRVLNFAISVLTVTSLSAAMVWAADDASETRRPPSGSLASQKRLKHRLRQISHTPLSATLQHNRQAWQELTPDERSRYRKNFLAFHQKDPKRREEMLKKYEQLFKMSAQRREAYRKRAEWLKIVISSFTKEQREELKKMTPTDRANKILEKKALLVKQGKIKAEKKIKKPKILLKTSKIATTQPAKKIKKTVEKTVPKSSEDSK